MSKILILSRKWSTGRGRYTSVERFCELLDPGFPTDCGERIKVPPAASRFFRSHTNSITSDIAAAPYNSWSFELELWGLKRILQNRYQAIFFPYADYDYYYFQYVRQLVRVPLILWSFFSVHELHTRFRNLDHFAAADLVLVAGKEQQACIARLNPRVRTAYFPIGVDTDFFIPVVKKQKTHRIVQVGANRRDFETLIQGLDLVYQADPDLRVDIIGASQVRDRLAERPYLTIHPYIDDAQMRAMIQQADVGVLCLEDGGSSNSLLEMMACGLPVVVTDLENVRDYLDDAACLRIPKSDPLALGQCCQRLLDDEDLRTRMSAAARLQAEKYAWITLKQKFDSILAEQKSRQM